MIDNFWRLVDSPSGCSIADKWMKLVTTFWMTYKLDKWPIERLREVVARVRKNGYADEAWRIHAWRKAKEGDTAFVFKQGADPRGIIGIGTITGKPELNSSESPNPSNPQYFAPTRWRRLVDPTKEFLLGYEDIKDFVPPSLVNTQASGITVSPEIAARLHELLPRHSHPHPDGSDDIFNPSDIEDGRERIMATIHRRQGQGAFREVLLTAYRGRCAITRCGVEAVLEAAHIYPYRGSDTNHVTNGLLLRADLHTLFDLGLIAIDSKNFTVLTSRKLAGSAYEKLNGCKIRLPLNRSERPSVLALDLHREQTFQSTKELSFHDD